MCGYGMETVLGKDKCVGKEKGQVFLNLKGPRAEITRQHIAKITL